MSFKDSWQQQRQQRQQEVAQRRQAVYQILATVQQERQNRSSQLWGDLSLSRQMLMRHEEVRRQNFQQLQAALQQFHTTLSAETQAFLAAERDRRQIQAQQLAQQLDEFVQALQQQTAQFLALTIAERITMADQLAVDLHAFRQALSQQVLTLRYEIQASVAALKAETQQFLSDSRQQQQQVHLQTLKDLAAFMETLRATVHNYLSEMEVLRQCRAEQIRTDLKQSRADRTAEMQAMFQRLAEFRAELRQFHANLQTTVWGQATSRTVESQPQKRPVTKPATQPIARTVAPITSKPTSKPVSKPTSKPVSKPATPATPRVAAPSNIKTNVAPTGPGPTVAVSQPEGMAYEKEVYNYIHKIQGARLTEIESSLGINRFEAVDALRSLIKKGLITQRDRVYLVQDTLIS